MSELYKKAVDFARKKHKGQKRKHSDTPYFTHPDRVAKLLNQYTDNQELLAAALLHDTIEDTDASYQEIKDEFGQIVADWVMELTSDKDEKNKVGKSEYLADKINHISPEARLVKLLDRYDNVRGLENSPEKFSRYYAKQTDYILSHMDGDLSDPEQKIVEKIHKCISPYM